MAQLMPKLILFDLDSVTYTDSNSQLIQDPTDRMLYPGVLGRLNKLRRAGWAMGLVANQTDCDWQRISARDLTIGSYFRMYREDKTISNTTFRTKEIEIKRFFLDIRTMSGGWFYLGLDDDVLARDKDIDQAINEMSIAADLCGIEEFTFCPCTKGYNAIESAKVGGVWRSASIGSDAYGQSSQYGNFLKPGPGLLNRAKRFNVEKFDRCVFIGLEPLDRATANEADFEFIEANDWRSSRVFV